MALQEIELDASDRILPEDVNAFLEDAHRRIEGFVRSRLDDPIPGFVPSDFTAVYRTLAHIGAKHLAPGRFFCEWGSGYGVVACLAAMLGFDACGIEIEEDLVEASVSLAEDHELPVEFVAGSFLPVGGEDVADRIGDFTWLRTDAACAYEDLGLDPEDFDVVFAYPWPGEEDAIFDLFERYAATGALLVTYQGVEDVRVRRKVS